MRTKPGDQHSCISVGAGGDTYGAIEEDVEELFE